VSELRAACHGRVPERDGWPTVSVVVPVRDEAAHLEHAIASILGQDYPLPFDVCLAVAPSHDGTEDVAARLALSHDRVSVVSNPAGVTPAGLNAAIRATTGSIVVRVDGHAQLSRGYIRRAVDTMCRTGAVNVGGRQVPQPETTFEHAVAAATTSWMGTGGASYRVGGRAGAVDTVYLGVFDRMAGDAVGWFDESLIRNQDYELNIRLRKAGGTVWFDPGLWVGYRPRGTWKSLARQYYEYGWWKAEVLRRYPGTVRLRQAVPAAATVVVATGTIAGAVGYRRYLAIPLVYATACAAAASRVAGNRSDRAAVAAVIAVLQLSWGAGATSSLARRCFAPNPAVGR
jgi:succinoglycan biosynthesis protein ExoA